MKLLKEKKKNQEKKNCRFKKHLKDNKIFFETITSLLLSVMAIVVSVVSVSMQKEANELQEKQVLLAEQQNMPVFNVSYKYYESYVENDISYPDGQEINIINNGGNILNGYLSAKTQIEVVIYDENNQKGIIVIEDLGGYPKKYSYYDSETKRFTIKRDSIIKTYELCRFINNQLNNKYEEYSFIAFYKDYINLQYTDFQNVFHNNWYDLSEERLTPKTTMDNKPFVHLSFENSTYLEILSEIEKGVDDVLKSK